MPAVSTFDSSKAIMKDAVVKEAVDHAPDIWPVEDPVLGGEEPVLVGEPLIIELFQFLKIHPVKCRFAALLWRI